MKGLIAVSTGEQALGRDGLKTFQAPILVSCDRCYDADCCLVGNNRTAKSVAATREFTCFINFVTLNEKHR